MRWKGIIFLGVLTALILVLSILFMDDWLENKIESAGTLLNGAKVEIDNLEISLTELYAQFKEWFRDSLPGQKVPIKNDVKEYFARLWGTRSKR